MAKAKYTKEYFDIFWAAYPKKASKLYAEKCFNRLKDPKQILAQILKALEWQKREWAKNDPKYIPNPSTYLNQGKWMDEQKIDLPTLEEFDRQQQGKLTEAQMKKNTRT